MEGVSRANSLFALDLYRALSASSAEGNIFFSPLSISAALSMVYLGARGDTAGEMEKMYVDSTMKLYHAEPQTVDFIRAADDSRQFINKWVEKQTENQIKDLLQPGVVNEMTRLLLVNAIYFKGNWMHTFDAHATKEMPFKINQNESRPVQMMDQVENFPYRCIPEYKLQVLELPYTQQELSMLILLPDEIKYGSDPLLKLESELNLQKLLDWTSRGKMDTWRKIIVRLPKFKLEIESCLSETLEKMGMSSVFQETKADLTGMSSNGGLFLSAVIHKAFVEVNEEGTEAAAATALLLPISCCRGAFHDFIADHPFMFFIRHNPTNSILFLGRFRAPS